MQELPNGIASKYDEIINKIESFSNEYLNEEYKNICVAAVETLCLNNEEQLKKGKSFSWAAGVVHAIGTINNLFDSKEKPYIKVSDLYKEFGVSSSTGLSKSKEVKKLLGLSEENKQWIIGENKEVSSKQVVKGKEEVAATIDNEKTFKFAIGKKFIEAQRIVNEAWKQKNYMSKAKYAKKALEVCEDCTDAYIILSRDSSLNNEKKKVILERAVESANNVLKIDSLETAPSEIFELKISQLLFGAKYALAIHLWQIGEKDAAIEHSAEILKYSKEDNLVIRNQLINWLLIQEKYTELEELLKQYEKDNSAAINYSRVVLLYKTDRIKEAENALRRAYKRNRFVISYILRQKKVPNTLPHLIGIGSEEEAIRYASLELENWNDSNMIKWLKEKKKEFDIINFA